MTMSTLMADRTVIQVTHGSSRARRAGRVFILDQGTLHQAIAPLPALAAHAPLDVAS